MSEDINENEVEQEAVQEEAIDAEAIIKEAFDEAVSAESDEDNVKMAMIQAGATFKNVTRLYNQFMIDAGLAISKADRDQIIADTLEGREFEESDDFESAVNDVVEAVTGATERSAAAIVRAYCKKNELPCYTKPKGAGGSKAGFANKFYAFLVENPSCTQEEAVAFVQGEGDHEDTSENVKKHQSHYLAIAKMANSIAEK